MIEELFKYMRHYSSKELSKAHVELIKSSFKERHLKKKQSFLHAGEICTHFAFIVKGAMRQYIVGEKGLEHTVQLGIENWWMADRESFVTMKPATSCIDAWEDSKLLIITRANASILREEISAFSDMNMTMDERNSIATNKRIIGNISLTAEKRYTDFAERYPEHINRFPQHIIASYLGITKETLSRVLNQS